MLKQNIHTGTFDDRPLSGLGVFELRRPRLDGTLNSPLTPTMVAFTYVSGPMQAGLQAARRNANPTVFVQSETKELMITAEEKLADMERGQLGVNQRNAQGAEGVRAIVEEERMTLAMGLHEVAKNGRHGSSSIFEDGTTRDRASGSMRFLTTGLPNLFPLLPNQEAAAGPRAFAPDNLENAIQHAEHGISRTRACTRSRRRCGATARPATWRRRCSCTPTCGRWRRRWRRGAPT